MNHSRLLVVLSLLTACTNQDEPFELVSLTATPDSFVEQQEQTLTLTAEITGTPDTHRWLQVSGPPCP